MSASGTAIKSETYKGTNHVSFYWDIKNLSAAFFQYITGQIFLRIKE